MTDDLIRLSCRFQNLRVVLDSLIAAVDVLVMVGGRQASGQLLCERRKLRLGILGVAVARDVRDGAERGRRHVRLALAGLGA